MVSARKAFGIILFLCCFTLLIGLGTWQLQRLAWKEEMISALDREFEKEASQFFISPEDFKKQPEDSNFFFRRGTISGTFLPGSDILVGPRTHDGKPGYHVFTPFRLTGGPLLLVNRGWISFDASKSYVSDIVHYELRILVGNIRAVGRPRLIPDNRPADGQWLWPDPVAVSNTLNLPDLTIDSLFYVETSNPPYTGVQPLSDRPFLRNTHLSYAIFWFVMALVWGGFGIYWIRAYRQG